MKLKRRVTEAKVTPEKTIVVNNIKAIDSSLNTLDDETLINIIDCYLKDMPSANLEDEDIAQNIVDWFLQTGNDGFASFVFYYGDDLSTYSIYKLADKDEKLAKAIRQVLIDTGNIDENDYDLNNRMNSDVTKVDMNHRKKLKLQDMCTLVFERWSEKPVVKPEDRQKIPNWAWALSGKLSDSEKFPKADTQKRDTFINKCIENLNKYYAEKHSDIVITREQIDHYLDLIDKQTKVYKDDLTRHDMLKLVEKAYKHLFESLKEEIVKEDNTNGEVIAKIQVDFDPDRFIDWTDEEQVNLMGYNSVEEYEEEEEKEYHSDDFIEYIGEYDVEEFFEDWGLKILKKEPIDYFSDYYYVEGFKDEIEKACEDTWFITNHEFLTVKGLLNLESLQEAKKDDELPADPEAVKTQAHTALNTLVTDEIEAIDGYEEAKAEIADMHIEHKDDIISTLDHIEDEEKEHIDELINAASEIPFEGESESVSDKKIEEIPEEPVEVNLDVSPEVTETLTEEVEEADLDEEIEIEFECPSWWYDVNAIVSGNEEDFLRYVKEYYGDDDTNDDTFFVNKEEEEEAKDDFAHEFIRLDREELNNRVRKDGIRVEGDFDGFTVLGPKGKIVELIRNEYGDNYTSHDLTWLEPYIKERTVKIIDVPYYYMPEYHRGDDKVMYEALSNKKICEKCGKAPCICEDNNEVELNTVVKSEEIEQPSEEIITNAFEQMINDSIKQHWDIISNLNAIIATLEFDYKEANKEDIQNIMNELVDQTTINVGMLYKVLELVSGKTSDLIDKGIEKADGIVDEPVKESLNEDLEPWDQLMELNLPQKIEVFKAYDKTGNRYKLRKENDYWVMSLSDGSKEEELDDDELDDTIYGEIETYASDNNEWDVVEKIINTVKNK